MTFRRARTLLAIALAFLGTSTAPALSGDAYRVEVEAFRKAREATLKADDGWLTVSGLFWVKPGETRIGGDPSSDVLLPSGAPEHLGVLTMAEGKATFRVDPGAGRHARRPAVRVGRDPLRRRGRGKSSVLAFGRFKLLLLKRGARHALRLKDNASEIRENFAGLRWFPVDQGWKVEAKFVPHPLPSRITFDTIVGEADVHESPGYATFERDGKTYRLDAAAQPDGRLWFVFRDATSGRTTPANARQLTAEAPLGDVVVLDFNKAVNLPCAYTPHATCPIAPPQNRLPLAVTAGERNYQPTARTAARED